MLTERDQNRAPEEVEAKLSYEAEDVIVLDGAKLKVLIKEYARECIKEELKNILQLLTIWLIYLMYIV